MNTNAPFAGKPATLCRLRRAVTAIEKREADFGIGSRALEFGISEMDDILQGGLVSAALHEVAAVSWRDHGAAIGFILALATRVSSTRKTLWIQTDFAAHDSGAVYGPGYELFGLSLSELLILKAARPLDALWAMEEALKCRALASVICELPNEGALADLTATRRLTLAARESGSFAFLLRQRPSALTSSAETRWEIAAAPGVRDRFGGLGCTALFASLTKNRRGPTAQWKIVWNHHERAFSSLSRGMAQAAIDRPDRALLARAG
jgi:protein ImuA